MPIHAINWFEIPATDFNRALAFYSAILATPINEVPMPNLQYAFLPSDNTPETVGGAIACGEGFVPSADGAVVYLNGGDDLNNILNRVEEAGGQVILPKMSLGEFGNMALFIDSEGNKIGLHSMN